MNHKETIELIQKLVPSIMELEFGCEVDTGVKRIVLEKRDNVIQTYSGGIVFTNKVEQLGNFEILGKPITLAVVLRAIERKNECNSNPKYWEDMASLVKEVYIDGVWQKNPRWNLSKDNFNDQSEETKAFIGGLLNN